MKNNTRRIVILNRPESSCIEQAIFILRDREESGAEITVCETDAVSEAQRIIDSYTDKLKSPLGELPKEKRINIFTKLLLFAAFAAALALVFCLVR